MSQSGLNYERQHSHSFVLDKFFGHVWSINTIKRIRLCVLRSLCLGPSWLMPEDNIIRWEWSVLAVYNNYLRRHGQVTRRGFGPRWPTGGVNECEYMCKWVNVCVCASVCAWWTLSLQGLLWSLCICVMSVIFHVMPSCLQCHNLWCVMVKGYVFFTFPWAYIKRGWYAKQILQSFFVVILWFWSSIRQPFYVVYKPGEKCDFTCFL